ncbi:MAG: NfeD family protein [Clostridiaceae bacterium]|nr:NfeD family protein [Clostridiaceae bacterium]
MAWLYWLIAIIFFTIAEALTVSMISVWFIVGSLVAMFVSLFGGTVTWQIISFIVISTIGLIIYLVWIKQRLTRNDKIIERTNADRILEQEGIVIQTINPIENTGLIKVKGQTWSANSYEEQIIEKDTIIIVKEIKGVRAIVIPKN